MSRPRPGVGQSGDGPAHDAPSPGDRYPRRPEQRPAAAGGRLRSAPGERRTGCRRVEGGAAGGGDVIDDDVMM